jgi:dTDP-4-amino-4,6-dideoxygalactose transaminase
MIQISKSCIGDSEKQAVMGVLNREYLGMGAETKQLEEELTKFFGRPAVCVSTGTAALHLALQAIGVGSGDEVLVQSLTYVASFQAISATGAKPVACDINPATLCLDWRDAEKRITANTKAVMPVHYSGGVGELNEIYDFANKYGLRVIEDAAHAFGTEFKEKKIGGFGDVACFSFDGIKNISAGEGGCIVSDDEVFLQKVQDARLLGIEKDSEKRFSGERSWQFDVYAQGWRYHMSNIMAAIGLKQLGKFPQMALKRQRLAKLYDSLLADHEHIHQFFHDYESVVPHIYVVCIEGMKDRKELQEIMLQEKNIQTGIHYQPNHWLSLYRDQNMKNLPVTERYFPKLLTLPLHPELTEKDVYFIVNSLKDLLY